MGPTYKVELIGKDPEEGLTVQGEHDGEVGAQRAPHKHMVDNCPEACVKSDLHNHTQRCTVNTQWRNRQQLNMEVASCRNANTTPAPLTCTLTTMTRAVAVVTAKVW